MNKIIARTYPIALNGFRSILNPLFAIIFSYVIVNYFSKELWGVFVEYVLFFLIAIIVCNWGNKSYLLRAFSKNPKNMIANWQDHFLARTAICLLCVGVIVFVYPWQLIGYLVLWLLGTFIYNSFLVIIYYNRDYIKSISIEVIGFCALIIQLLAYQNNLDLALLIRSYAISIAVKAIVSAIYYYPFLKFKTLRFNIRVLKLSLPFFILGVTGFLQSKVDVYAYSFFYDGKLLGEYQIISGLFIFAASLITLLSFPYIKNFYRLKTKSIQNLKKVMIKYGILINLIAIAVIYILLFYAFNIKLSAIQIGIGYFISFPSYVYTTHIYNLIKNKKDIIIVKISLYSFIINLILSLFLLYLGCNVTGVMLANAIAQLFCMFYALRFKINE